MSGDCLHIRLPDRLAVDVLINSRRLGGVFFTKTFRDAQQCSLIVAIANGRRLARIRSRR